MRPFHQNNTEGYCPAKLRSHSSKTHLGLHHPLCQLGKEFCGTAPVSNRADGADAGAHGHDVGVTALEKQSVLGVIQQVFKHHTGVVDSSSATLGTPYLRHYTYSIDFKFGLHTKNKLEFTANITYSVKL